MNAVFVIALTVTLVSSGAAKLFSPTPLANSLDLVMGIRGEVGMHVARAVALYELVLAVAWVIPPFRQLASVGTIIFGLGICGFALRAMLRSVSVACGCFGESGGSSLGWRNIIAGFGMAAISGWLFYSLPAAQASLDPKLVLLVTSGSALTIGIIQHQKNFRLPTHQ